MDVRFKIPDAPEYSFAVREPGVHPMSHPKAAVVELDLIKIDSHLSEADYGYVGPNGSDSKAEKHQRVRSKIENGEVIDMPVMYAVLGGSVEDFRRSVHVGDGRHRLWNLKNVGLRRVQIVVPAFQADLFVQVFG